MPCLVSIYKRALQLLPVTYRERYADPMVQTLEDMLADQQTVLDKWRVWLRTMMDLPATTARQYAQAGGSTMNQSPKYAKLGTVLSATMLMPFIVIVTINAMAPLADRWTSVGYFGVFILPSFSLILSLIVLGRLFASHDLWTRLRGLRQIQNNWILFAVSILAFVMVSFAFGHDGGHCVSDSPLHALVNPVSTIECVANG